MDSPSSILCGKEEDAMLQIDQNTEFGARVARRLANDLVIWLTTVRPSMRPDPSIVWFWWDGKALLIYSKPNTQKLRNIARNPNVALHFDGDGSGGDIIVITGTAHVDEDAPPANQIPAYAEKYAERMENNRMTAESFARAYSVAIRVTPTKLRGH
jgi:PPOX class probable F420-dependent enzyme